MKEIKAIIQPFMLAKVIHALKNHAGLPGVTVSEVKGFGKGQAKEAEDKIIDDSVEYVKKVKLEIVVPDNLYKEVVEIIKKNAHTGRAGDGKIFVYDVKDVIKVSSGEHGEEAI